MATTTNANAGWVSPRPPARPLELQPEPEQRLVRRMPHLGSGPRGQEPERSRRERQCALDEAKEQWSAEREQRVRQRQEEAAAVAYRNNVASQLREDASAADVANERRRQAKLGSFYGDARAPLPPSGRKPAGWRPAEQRRPAGRDPREERINVPSARGEERINDYVPSARGGRQGRAWLRRPALVLQANKDGPPKPPINRFSARWTSRLPQPDSVHLHPGLRKAPDYRWGAGGKIEARPQWGVGGGGGLLSERTPSLLSAAAADAAIAAVASPRARRSNPSSPRLPPLGRQQDPMSALVDAISPPPDALQLQVDVPNEGGLSWDPFNLDDYGSEELKQARESGTLPLESGQASPGSGASSPPRLTGKLKVPNLPKLGAQNPPFCNPHLT